MNNRWIGLDIGGANLKACSSDGWARNRPFPLWRRRDQLTAALADLLKETSPDAPIAVTMTGELADCYRDRDEGVRHIIASLLAAAEGRHLRVYSLDGQFVTAEMACAAPDTVAAGNWHALSLWLARQSSAPGVLVDIGSTTTDIIPLLPGRVATGARTDHDRLLAGQLLYFGAQRTPVCALVSHLPFREQAIPVMAEAFATTDDCALVLGRVAEAPDETDTADGRPRTAREAANRLAKMIGLDHRSVSLSQARMMAAAVLARLQERLREAIDHQRRSLPEAEGNATLWLSGHGTWMVPATGGLSPRDLNAMLDPRLVRAAPALAVANLAADEPITAEEPA